MWVVLASVLAFIGVALLPGLPTLAQLSGVCGVWLVAGGAMAWRWPPWRLLLLKWSVLLLSLVWAMGWGAWQLERQLPASLEGQDLRVAGAIGPDVQTDERLQRFNFFVASVTRTDGTAVNTPFPRQLRLSSYQRQSLMPGQGWQFTVRLKRPHGYASPGAFDYEGWLFSRGLGATGYIRWGSENFNQPLPELDASLSRWRGAWLATVRQQLPDDFAGAMLMALAFGDRSFFSPSQQTLLQRSGLAHLVAISGLHIGLAAGLGALLMGGLARTLSVFWPLQVFTPRWQGVGGLALALLYAWLAGFPLSAQRAWIMVLVATLWLLSYRRPSPWWALSLALLLILLLQPLAVLEAGLWFSFTAVVVLLLMAPSGGSRWRDKLWLLLKLQGVLFVAMLMLQSFWGMPVSITSPLLNLVAVPLVSLVVVPLVLAALLIGGVWPDLGQLLWRLAHGMCQGLTDVLSGLEPVLSASLLQLSPVGGPVAVVLGVLAALVMCLPLAAFTRALGVMLFLAVALATPGRQGPGLSVLDVGQGLAVVVSDGDKHLLYDTGAAYGDSTVADSVVIPWLQQRGVHQLQYGVVSHWDQDHAGGVTRLQDWVQHWVVSPPATSAQMAGLSSAELCDEDRQWQMGVWQVRSLGLSASALGSRHSNNRSCVLLLDSGDFRVLLSGDIETEREIELLQHPWLQQSVDLLLAPHHGSKTSSSEAFLRKLQPRWVVVSSGYRNRYGHPHPKVMARYRHFGVPVWITADRGTLAAARASNGRWEITPWRSERVRYWHWQPE